MIDAARLGGRPAWLLVVMLFGACVQSAPPPAPALPIAPPKQKPSSKGSENERAPAPSYALHPDAYLSRRGVEAPRLVRWHPLVWDVVGEDPRSFALMMTLITVESGGAQFAISRSGCAGLLQFCAGTAVRPPFSRFFPLKDLRICDCAHRRCRVPFKLRRFLETMPPGLHGLVADELPCDLGDPRFEPRGAISAGWTYVDCLARRFGGNRYLIYIGYNSGPKVAERIWRRLGEEKARELKNISRVLRGALRPNFGWRWSKRRARSLSRVHLPKFERIYQSYAEVARTLALRGRPPYVRAEEQNWL